MKALCLFILFLAFANAAFDHIAYSTAYSNQLGLNSAAVDHGLLCFQGMESILNTYKANFLNTIKAVPVTTSYAFLTAVDGALKNDCPIYFDDIDSIVSEQASATSKNAISTVLTTYNAYFQELFYEWAEDFQRGDFAKAGQNHAYLYQAALAILDPSKAPKASFTTTSIVGFTAKNDASSSSATFGATIAGLSWTFGELASATNTASGKDGTHTYAALGNYVVRLVVTDNRGKKSVLTKTIAITNIPPTAKFAPPVKNNLKVTVDCSTSEDQDGTVATSQCAWDFGEATSSSNKATGATAEHTYAAPGRYTITLDVVDNKGAPATFSQSVTVESAKPTADIKPPVIKYLNVNFDGSLSQDPDGTIKTYAWSFGDGKTASSQTVSHTYAKPGRYDVTLEVTDNNGQTGTKTLPVTVDTAYPQASFVVDPSTNLRIEGSAAKSSDLDGPIVKYTWNFGDSTGDIVGGPTFSHIYAAAKTYTVKLTVEDEHGAKGTTSQQVTVVNAKPTASFSVTQKDYHQIDLDASTSSDPYGTIKTFTWNFGDDTGDFAVSDSTIISHTYATPNTYTVTLTVQDNFGETGTTSKIVKIETDPLIVELNKKADNLGGLINTNTKTLEEKNAAQDKEITKLTEENEKQDTADGELTKKNEDQDKEITRLSGENTRQDTTDGELVLKNQEQDGRLKAVEDKNTEQDTSIGTLQTDNLEQDGQIRTVEATNTREDADIKALKDYDPLQDTRIKGVEEKNAKQDTDIKAVQDYNVDQDADIVAMEKENTDLKAGLQYMTKRQYFGMTISDDWETFTSGSTKGLRTYVDLSHLNLKNVPHVTVSLEGDNDVWKVIGGSYLYTLDNKGFSVFIRYDSEQVLTLADAIQNDWHLDYTVTSIPIARFDTTISNLYVQGDGSKSSYEDQPLTRLIWDFGDNTAPVIGSAPSHSYSADGTYKITLTGEDKYGVINKVSKKVTVGASTATVFWNFDNSITTGASSNPAISGVASSVGGSIQLWWVSPDRVLFTQFFGQNYLYIAITTTKIVKLSTVSFLHYHNHNPGYPNEHPYQVRLQISSTVNSNSAYSPISGATFTADPITHMTVTTVNLGETLLQPGTHYIRWLPNIATTSSGYFAIDNINLKVKVQN